jgi:dephospho-CoA kinase
MPDPLPAVAVLYTLVAFTGPPGCGKSTAVRVLACELGYELVEWTPPAPTLWSELLQQVCENHS